MSLLQTLLSLQDRAIVAFYVLEKSGPLTISKFQKITGHSHATIYRALSSLLNANLVAKNGDEFSISIPRIDTPKPAKPSLKPIVPRSVGNTLEIANHTYIIRAA